MNVYQEELIVSGRAAEGALDQEGEDVDCTVMVTDVVLPVAFHVDVDRLPSLRDASSSRRTVREGNVEIVVGIRG